jgi:hypothetical protein
VKEIVMKKSFALLLLLPFLSAFANDGDLVLPGEKWLATFDRYTCDDQGGSTVAPSAFHELNVEFSQITTDSSLDNVLLKATFVEGGSLCRYSAILFADNPAHTVQLVESKSFAESGNSNCETGKAVLDAHLSPLNDYLYFGRPHNIAIMVPAADSKALCGSNGGVGVDFVVRGKVPGWTPSEQ